MNHWLGAALFVAGILALPIAILAMHWWDNRFWEKGRDQTGRYSRMRER